jgi:hypothetical protein
MSDENITPAVEPEDEDDENLTGIERFWKLRASYPGVFGPPPDPDQRPEPKVRRRVIRLD